MSDFTVWRKLGQGFGDRFYNAAGTLLGVDNPEPMTLAYRNDFRTQKDFKALTTSALFPVTNSSQHIYRPQQVTFGPTGLTIEAIKDASGQWWSGLAHTFGQSNYGQAGSGLQFLGAFRFKARVQMSSAKGLWPSIWFLPQPVVGTSQTGHYGSWPSSGEIDMFESISNGRFYWTVHGDNPVGSKTHWQQPAGNNFTTGVDVTQWHEIWLDWRPGFGFVWYLDGVETMRCDDGPNSPVPFNRPFYPIINLAVGGTFPGNTDGTTPTSGNFLKVDWFEAWSLGPDTGLSGTTAVPAVSPRALGAKVKLVKRNSGDPLIPEQPTPPTGGGGGTTPPPPPPATPRPWSDGSPWNTLISTSDAVYGTPQFTSTFFGSLGHAYVNDTGVFIYHGATTDPVITVTASVNRGTFGPSGTFQDRIPLNAVPATSSDHGLQVLGADGFIYDYYNMAINWTARTATCGARYKVPATATGFGPQVGTPVGSRAAGCSWVGGHISADDIAAVKAGKRIPHGLAIVAGNNLLKFPAVYPAISTDAGGNTAYFGPYNMGRLLAIKPSTPKPALSAIGSAVWDAFVDYGGYPVDRTNSYALYMDQGDRPVAAADIAPLRTAGSDGDKIALALVPVTGGKPSIPGHA